MFQRGKTQYVQNTNSPSSLSPGKNHHPPNCLWIPIDVMGTFFINIIQTNVSYSGWKVLIVRSLTSLIKG